MIFFFKNRDVVYGFKNVYVIVCVEERNFSLYFGFKQSLKINYIYFFNVDDIVWVGCFWKVFDYIYIYIIVNLRKYDKLVFRINDYNFDFI